MIPPIAVTSDDAARRAQYALVRASIASLLDDESDWIAAMATVSCELHNAFGYFHWTGFYRAVSDSLLVVGPYQGGHGCLRIDFARGVCGAAARTRQTQFVPDVHVFADHIACSSSTNSEVVVPVITPDGRLLAVLDVDSDDRAAFTDIDRAELEAICRDLGARYAATPQR